MGPGDLFLVLVAGFFATYVHLILALWAGRVGLARLDFSKGMAHLCFGESYEGHPPVVLGFLVVHLNGIFFALLYAYGIGRHLPGPPLVKGLLWGACLLAGSQLVFNPLVTKLGFFAAKHHPRAWVTAVAVHAVYGAVLGWLCPGLSDGKRPDGRTRRRRMPPPGFSPPETRPKRPRNPEFTLPKSDINPPQRHCPIEAGGAREATIRTKRSK